MKKTEERRKKLEKEMPKKIEAEYNRRMEPYKDIEPSLTETWAIHYTLKKEKKLARVSDKAKGEALYLYIWQSLMRPGKSGHEILNYGESKYEQKSLQRGIQERSRAANNH